MMVCRALFFMSTDQAALLLQGMRTCTGRGDPMLLGHALQHGLPLMARWTMQHRRRLALQKGEERTLLQRAVAWLLALVQSQALHSNADPPVAAAAVLFLGAAYPGVAFEGAGWYLCQKSVRGSWPRSVCVIDNDSLSTGRKLNEPCLANMPAGPHPCARKFSPKRTHPCDGVSTPHGS